MLNFKLNSIFEVEYKIQYSKFQRIFSNQEKICVASFITLFVLWLCGRAVQGLKFGIIEGKAFNLWQGRKWIRWAAVEQVGLSWDRLLYCNGPCNGKYRQSPSYFCNWSLENRIVPTECDGTDICVCVCVCLWNTQIQDSKKILIWFFIPCHRHLLCSWSRISLRISKPKTTIFVSKLTVYPTVTFFG